MSKLRSRFPGPGRARRGAGAVPAVPDAPYRRVLIVANPTAGRGQACKAAAELEEGLRSLGVPSVRFETKARYEARDRAAAVDAETDLVVAVGGDGTLREVLDGLPDPDVPVGVLPLGTANVLAGELGLPRDVHLALEVLANKRTRRLDVADVNGQLAFMVVGVGVDAMAVRDVELRRRGPITKWTYVGSILRTLQSYRRPRLAVEVDGKRLDGEWGFVIVSNLWNYGGAFDLDADTLIDDGLFEVYLFNAGSRWELFTYAATGLVGRLPGRAGTMVRAKRVRVHSAEPVPIQADGDYRGETPLDLRVRDVQYRIIVP